jgi:hypothetical protein
MSNVIGRESKTFILLLALAVKTSCTVEVTIAALDPAGFTVLSSQPSPHGVVEVIDVPPQGLRVLRLGRSIIGAAFLNARYRDQEPFPNFALLQSAAMHYRTTPPSPPQQQTSILMLGLGAGVVASRLRWSGRYYVDVVERSTEVIRAASDFFGYDASDHWAGRTLVTDAAADDDDSSDGGYDIVVHDLFSGSAARPSTLGALKRSKLRPGGLMLLNFVGYPSKAGGRAVEYELLTVAQQRALARSFAHVRCFADAPLRLIPPGEPSNIVCAATDGDEHHTRSEPLAWDVAPLQRNLSTSFRAASLQWPMEAPSKIEDVTSDYVALHFHDATAGFELPQHPFEVTGQEEQEEEEEGSRGRALARLNVDMWENLIKPLLPNAAAWGLDVVAGAAAAGEAVAAAA